MAVIVDLLQSQKALASPSLEPRAVYFINLSNSRNQVQSVAQQSTSLHAIADWRILACRKTFDNLRLACDDSRHFIKITVIEHEALRLRQHEKLLQRGDVFAHGHHSTQTLPAEQTGLH